MKVLMTGATGYIGAAVARALRGAGHAVHALARSDESAAKVEARGDHVVRGQLRDGEALARAAAVVDGVVHLAMTRDSDPAEADGIATRAVLEALRGTRKPFLYTAGVWDYGDTGGTLGDEDSPLHPLPMFAWRVDAARLVLASAPDVRSVVVRPGDVYGEGGGLPAMWSTSARKGGAAKFIGSGQQHWSMVHVRDLADLYVRALESAPAGTVLVGVAGQPVRVQAMAEAASRGAGAGGRTEAWSVADASRALGPWVAALALDQRLSGARAQRILGWTPQAPSPLEDLERGSYA